MPAAVICIGLACGALLAGTTLALWHCLRPTSRVPHALRVIRWMAGALLTVGALVWWQGNHHPPAPALPLILMAAIAAPPRIKGGTLPRQSHALLILPALALAGVGLFWISAPVVTSTGSTPMGPLGLAVTVCGGLGARAASLALSEAATSSPRVERPTTAAFALLTLITGSAALVTVWQRGTVWVEAGSGSGLAGAWLAWAAAWVSRRQSRWLRAALILVAAVSLIVLAAGYSVVQEPG